MSGHQLVVARIRPEDLTLGGTTDRMVAHLLVRTPTGTWPLIAVCGHAAWCQSMLNAELLYPPNLAGMARCGAPWCARLWPFYDLGRRR